MSENNSFSVLIWKKSEALLVGAVIVLIVLISYAQIKNGEMKTRDAQRKADVELTARALGKIYEETGFYPPAYEGKIVSCGSKGLGVCEWGEGPIVDVDDVTYLKNLPRDPLTDKGYKYVYTVDEKRENFWIYIALENKRDPERKDYVSNRCGNNLNCNWLVKN